MLLRRRFPVAMLGVVVFLGLLAGCVPAPDPTPTPTPLFASDEEAFAAAEEVYRAYIEAGNDEREGRKSVDPTMYITGDALESDLEVIRDLQSRQLRVSGSAQVTSFTGRDADIGEVSVVLTVEACLDVSSTRVLDSAGNDVTPPLRQQSLPLSVTLRGFASDLLITNSTLMSEEPC